MISFESRLKLYACLKIFIMCESDLCKCTFKFLEVILMSCAKHFLNFKRRMKINAKNWRKSIKNLG